MHKKVWKNPRHMLIAVLMLISLSISSSIIIFIKSEDSVELVFFVDKTLLPLFHEVDRSLIPVLEKSVNVEITINLVTGSSGFVLSQMNLTERGDLYGSDDYYFAKMAVDSRIVDPSSVRIIGYITLAILLPDDSGLNVSTLHGLITNHTGLKIAIGDPTHVAAGRLVKELLNATGLWNMLWENHNVILAPSASDVASLVRSGNVDAGITFDTFYLRNPEGLRMVMIEPELNVRAAPIVIAASKYTQYPNIVKDIIDYMSSDEFVSVIKKYGFKTYQDVRTAYPHMVIPTLSDIINS